LLALEHDPTVSTFENMMNEGDLYPTIDTQTVVSDFKSPKAIRADLAERRRQSFHTENTGTTAATKQA